MIKTHIHNVFRDGSLSVISVKFNIQYTPIINERYKCVQDKKRVSCFFLKRGLDKIRFSSFY
jgi:hypothetical protein